MKITCPFHDDGTASLHVYEDHFNCFGCGARGSIEQLEAKIPSFKTRLPVQHRAPENLEESIARVTALPLSQVRGLSLQTDQRGYYIVYPNAKYYVRRSWTDDEPRFYAPVGVRKPLYALRQGGSTLVLIEGQINALSALESVPDHAVISPGASTDFNKPGTVEECLRYSTIYIVVDNDAAGVVAAVQLRDTLLFKGKRVIVIALDDDFNSILVNLGKEALNNKIKESIYNDK